MKKTVVFLGSKATGLYCLKQLFELHSKNQISLLGVLTNDNTSGNKQSISSYSNQKNISVIPSLDQLIQFDHIDFIISVQYHQIIPKNILNLAKIAAVNLHMAPLPEYRGCNQFSFSIIDKKTEFGTTWHSMRPGIDNGDILFEKRFPIPENCDVMELHKLTEKKIFKLIDEHLNDILNNKFDPIPQKTLISKRGSSFHKRIDIEKIKKIDLSWPDEKIDLYIRATYFPPFPPLYTIIGNKKFELSPNWKTEIKE